jgi:hypothetical protein
VQVAFVANICQCTPPIGFCLGLGSTMLGLLNEFCTLKLKPVQQLPSRKYHVRIAWPPSALASPPPTPQPLTKPPKSIFLGSIVFPILNMCLAHYMCVLLNVVGIYSMLHLATTFTLFSFCHHFTPNSLCKKPMWMALNFPAWVCVSAHNSHL